MTMSTDKRKEYLKGLRDNGKPVRTAKVSYKGETEERKIYRIELKYLIFNPLNDRIATEMMTWQTENNVSPDLYNEEIHKQIRKFIWESNVARNKATLKDLKKKGQQQHGVVTLDGVVVSGNRRFLLLSEISGQEYFEAAILDDEYAGNEAAIIRLETEYQYQDSMLEYGPLQKYLKVKKMVERGIDIEEIAELMGEKENKIREWNETMEIMDRYLALLGYDGLYELLKDGDEKGTKEDEFLKTRIDLKAYREKRRSPDWAYNVEDDVDQLESILFDHIRYGKPGKGEKDFRLISNEGGGSKSFFHYKDIWKEFAEKHAKEVDTITAEETPFDEYTEENPEIASRVEAARVRDAEWRENVTAPIQRNFGQSTDLLDAKVEGAEPTRLLRKALNALQEVDYEHDEFTQSEENERMVKKLGKLVWDMKKRFEKV